MCNGHGAFADAVDHAHPDVPDEGFDTEYDYYEGANKAPLPPNEQREPPFVGAMYERREDDLEPADGSVQHSVQHHDEHAADAAGDQGSAMKPDMSRGGERGGGFHKIEDETLPQGWKAYKDDNSGSVRMYCWVDVKAPLARVVA